MKSLYCQQMLGASHCILKDAEFHLQEGRPVLPPQWNSPLPGLMLRSTGATGSEPQTTYGGPSRHGSACHEGNLTHAAQAPRGAEGGQWERKETEKNRRIPCSAPEGVTGPATTGGSAWSLGAGREPPREPGDDKFVPWLRTQEWAAQAS